MAHISKNPKLNSLTLGGAKDDSAILDLTSTTQGLGLPNMTEAERDAISSPKAGLKIFNTTTAKENIYNGGVWEETGGAGGGSGVGEINFISNGDAESNATTGWATYDDGDVAAPVDGTLGTSVNTTFTSQDTVKLRGNYSFRFAKTTTSSARGEGVSYDFAVDKADQDTKLKIEFDFATDGSYTDDYMSVYIYDIDNSTLITPEAIGIKKQDITNNGSDKFSTTFKSTNSLNYRLIVHIKTGAIGVFSVYLDNVLVGIADEDKSSNYIKNNRAENGSTGWTTYKDAAGLVPVDGVDGSPITVTFQAQDTTVLQGEKSFKLTKSGSNLQGEGVSYDFTVDKADQNKLLGISFDYNTDGTYTAGDVVVYIYDKDTATLITPRVTEVTGYDKDSVGSVKFISDFSPVDTSSSNYRLIFHVADATTNVWDFYADNVKVWPDQVITSAVVTDWENITSTANTDLLPSGLGSGSGTYVEYLTRRVGDTLEGVFRFNMSAAGTGSTAVTFPYPNGYTRNATEGLSTGTGMTYSIETSSQVHPLSIETHENNFGIFNTGISTVYTGSDFRSNGQVRVYFSIPIAEWAGTGTVNLGANDVEYIYNTESTINTAGAVSKTAYGIEGTPILAHTTSSTVYRMTPQTPIQPTDTFEVQINSGEGWNKLDSNNSGSLGYTLQGAQAYGIYSYIDSNSDIVVGFTRYARSSNTSYAGAGQAWSAYTTYRWRVVKHRSGIPVGFGLADSKHAGLYKAGSVKGFTGGTAIPTGNVGEIIGGVTSSLATVSTTSTMQSFTPSKGVWLVLVSAYGASGIGNGQGKVIISNNSIEVPMGDTAEFNYVNGQGSPQASVQAVINVANDLDLVEIKLSKLSGSNYSGRTWTQLVRIH